MGADPVLAGSLSLVKGLVGFGDKVLLIQCKPFIGSDTDTDA